MLTEAQNLKESEEKSSACGASAEDIMSAPVTVRVSVGSFEPERKDRHPLYWLRTERGWTMEELAAISGVRSSQICLYETGATQPRLENAFRLAFAFNVTVDFLFGIPYKRMARQDQR